MQAGSRSDPFYGPFGPEGTRLREQLWIIPGADPAVPLRATLFRPPEAEGGSGSQQVRLVRSESPGRRPLVIINHGTDDATREAVSMPVFYWVSRWFVERGYVVLLPQRRGHGATGGELVEGRDSCPDPDHVRAGNAGADDIEATLRFMRRQSFIDASNITVVGVSTGGWASLALAGRNVPVRAIINFAGGRGGHAYGRPYAICGRDRLIEAAGAFGRTAKVPTLWIYSENDSYFGPELASAMALAWTTNGGRADLRLLPPYGNEGHAIVDDRAGWRLWGPEVERFLAEHAPDRPQAGPALQQAGLNR